MSTASAPRSAVGTNDIDLVDVEIFQRRLYSIASEMGLIMIRTSGDPTISEAVDFSTFIADAEGEIVSFSGYMTWHFGPARQTVRHIMKVVPREQIRPGDAFICNDPHTTGACHAPDIGIVRPIFAGEELVAWCWAEAHVLDIGGMAPGGFAPTAFECYAEGLRFPGIKIVSEGVLLDDIVRLIQANFRVPSRNLNDLRCFIAACNVCNERLQELLANYGVERFRAYNEMSKALSERAMRARIATLPDGVRGASAYVEHNGHVNDLYEIRLTLVVEGDSMTLDLTGTCAQTDGFINMSLGSTIAVAITPMLISLAPDVPINEGAIRAFEVIAPQGTIVNPVMPAPCGAGHIESGLRLSRLVMGLLAELQAASADPFVREHTLAPWGESFSGTVFYAPNDEGELLPFLDLHGNGTGGAAQPHVDGMDCGSNLTQLQTALPDAEIYEMQYPILYLWRRLNVGSGGAGTHRGGQGVELAFMPWRTIGGEHNAFTNCWQLPAPGVFGGYPAGTCGFRHLLGVDAEARIRGGEALLSEDQIGGEGQELEAKAMGLPIKPGDVVTVRVGGGGGFGDPLDRKAAAVVRDVNDGYITREIAVAAYGVMLDDAGGLDEPATEQTRNEMRSVRRQWPQPQHYSGNAPTAGRRQTVHPAIERVGEGDVGIYACRRCGTALAPAAADFRDYLCTRRSPAAELMAGLGARIIARDGVDLVERACPGCGTMMAVDVMVQEPANGLPAQEPRS